MTKYDVNVSQIANSSKNLNASKNPFLKSDRHQIISPIMFYLNIGCQKCKQYFVVIFPKIYSNDNMVKIHTFVVK